MVPNEKRCTLSTLFDSIPKENYIFSLLHVETGLGNKMINSFDE